MFHFPNSQHRDEIETLNPEDRQDTETFHKRYGDRSVALYLRPFMCYHCVYLCVTSVFNSVIFQCCIYVCYVPITTSYLLRYFFKRNPGLGPDYPVCQLRHGMPTPKPVPSVGGPMVTCIHRGVYPPPLKAMELLLLGSVAA